jgi:galactoside O-acetyltransferase
MKNIIFKKIGYDVRIDDLSRINNPELIELGNHISIDMCVYMSSGGIIGDYVHIAHNVSIIGGSTSTLIMEDFTGISAGSRIICASDDFNDGHLCPFVPLKYRHVINKPIIFKRFSCVGVNSVVMPGVILAEGSVLGANSLLTKNTEPWTIYVGSPAVAIKIRNSDLVLKGAKELGYIV